MKNYCESSLHALDFSCFFRCDLEKDRQYCFPIPYTEMEKIPGGPRCEWVQKQVCQDTPIDQPRCQNPVNRMCVSCDEYRQKNGAFDPNNGIYVPGIEQN